MLQEWTLVVIYRWWSCAETRAADGEIATPSSFVYACMYTNTIILEEEEEEEAGR